MQDQLQTKPGLGSPSESTHIFVLCRRMGLICEVNGTDDTQSLITIINELHPEPNHLDDLDDGVWEA